MKIGFFNKRKFYNKCNKSQDAHTRDNLNMIKKKCNKKLVK